MDLDKALVASIILGGKGAYRDVLKKGITAAALVGEGKDAFEFIQRYYSAYSDVPSMGSLVGKLGVDIDENAAVSAAYDLDPNPTQDKAGFFADEVLNRNLHLKISEGLKEPIELLDKRDPRGAFDSIEEMCFDIHRMGMGDSNVSSMLDEIPNLLDYYERIKSGERGILSPWPTINDSTLGFNAEELILFVARSGIGKTWASLMLAQKAWQDDHRILYITTEMSKLRIALRFFALDSRLPYGQIRSGNLDMYGESRFEKYMANFGYSRGTDPATKKVCWVKNAPGTKQDDGRLKIVGGNFDFRIEAVAAAIDEAKPDLVIIDGIYLLKTPGKDRMEKAANAFEEVKRLTVYRKLPIIVTSQFNREVKVNNAATAKAESVALTDAAVWHSTLIFGMVQTDDDKIAHRMQMKQLKVRDGSGKDFELDWNFDTMTFTEKVSMAPGYANATAGDASDVDLAGALDPGSGESTPF